MRDGFSNNGPHDLTPPTTVPTRRGVLQRKLLRWYSRHGRALPWRNIDNAYRILISEVMLQQTQVSRVRVKYGEFLQRFPTVKKLAQARRSEVVIAWRGMGYNNRAVRLHQLALAVLQEHRGRFPRTYEKIAQLPGIGRYTANAILSSAFGQDVPVVDVNVRRVLSRIFWRMRTSAVMRPQNEIWKLAETLIPEGRAYRWNQALMDLGATICTARAPRCKDCPVQSICVSRSRMKPTNRYVMRHEPSKDGIPNRVYRGKIVETLRLHHGRRWLSPDAIGRTIHPRYSFKYRTWLEKLLFGLQKDGLISTTKSRRWNDRRVTLA